MLRNKAINQWKVKHKKLSVVIVRSIRIWARWFGFGTILCCKSLSTSTKRRNWVRWHNWIIHIWKLITYFVGCRIGRYRGMWCRGCAGRRWCRNCVRCHISLTESHPSLTEYHPSWSYRTRWKWFEWNSWTPITPIKVSMTFQIVELTN